MRSSFIKSICLDWMGGKFNGNREKNKAKKN